jgi:hypothetical protein
MGASLSGSSNIDSAHKSSTPTQKMRRLTIKPLGFIVLPSFPPRLKEDFCKFSHVAPRITTVDRFVVWGCSRLTCNRAAKASSSLLMQKEERWRTC